jgi:hypothetical protein
MHMRTGSSQEIRAMQSMIGRGPVTIVLVFSRTCPHCTTYMPIWKKLCATQGRKANMISMEASTYQTTPMASQKQVSGVPTVLYVNKEGEISEASEPRNTTVMTNAVKLAPGSDLPASVTGSNTMVSANRNKTLSANSNLFNVRSTNSRVSTPSEPTPLSNSVVPGTMVSENPLPPTPAMTQTGGNPWAAFLLAAKQAAPAAVLLGAYAALPKKRSSGLSDPRKTRRRKSHRRHFK